MAGMRRDTQSRRDQRRCERGKQIPALSTPRLFRNSPTEAEDRDARREREQDEQPDQIEDPDGVLRRPRFEDDESGNRDDQQYELDDSERVQHVDSVAEFIEDSCQVLSHVSL